MVSHTQIHENPLEIPIVSKNYVCLILVRSFIQIT